MKLTLKNILASIGFSFVLIQFQYYVNSEYITSFLKENLITIIVSLLAVNTATTGIVLTKIRELIDNSQNKISFTNSKNEMKKSIIEQIVLVILALFFLTLTGSGLIKNSIQLQQIIDIFCCTIFIYDLFILYDTAKSVFIIIDFH
ncbi:hypothetical protein [Treponema denticola]|uniref:Uncharacterized protein n=1 Tax=Treponema denticola SP33 TaxID=999437 RepID=M2ABI7_TREDN|nr:hypothetical protein [Treponema denticola]EMB20016.1 hypothetical protein HMPREF9733_02572 [Treponema denticola SP33]EPF36157.1 hypothetical protein HMPREF9732_01870 [Treponema denticola SP32]